MEFPLPPRTSTPSPILMRPAGAVSVELIVAVVEAVPPTLMAPTPSVPEPLLTRFRVPLESVYPVTAKLRLRALIVPARLIVPAPVDPKSAVSALSGSLFQIAGAVQFASVRFHAIVPELLVQLLSAAIARGAGTTTNVPIAAIRRSGAEQ